MSRSNENSDQTTAMSFSNAENIKRVMDSETPEQDEGSIKSRQTG